MPLADFLQYRDIFTARNWWNQFLKIGNQMSGGILPYLRRDQPAFQTKFIQGILKTPQERYTTAGAGEKNLEFTHFQCFSAAFAVVMGMHSFLPCDPKHQSSIHSACSSCAIRRASKQSHTSGVAIMGELSKLWTRDGGTRGHPHCKRHSLCRRG